jgi:hypothetical protein
MISIERSNRNYLTNNKPIKKKSSVVEKKEPKSDMDYSYPEAETYTEENQNPETIKITYKTNVNIILIHKAIRKKFGFERSKLAEYEQKVADINLNNVKLSINDLRYCEKLKKELLTKIEEINSGSVWRTYIEEAKPYLEEYQALFAHNNKTIVIAGKKKENEEEKFNAELRINLIKEYTEIAAKYINIIIHRVVKTKMTCPVCETSFNDFEIDEDVGVCCCLTCGWYKQNISKESSRGDNRAIPSGKNDYEDRENFLKAIMRFSCKQSKSFHASLEDDLDEYFKGIGIASGEEIRQKKVVDGRKSGLDAQIMLRALSDLAKNKNPKYSYRKIYADYYEDVWLIMVNYWGFEPNDITHLTNDLMQMYDETQEIYVNLSPEERGGRDASLSTQVRLLLQLWALNYPCRKSDFKLPQHTSLENHQRLWKIMCNRTKPGWFREII